LVEQKREKRKERANSRVKRIKSLLVDSEQNQVDPRRIDNIFNLQLPHLSEESEPQSGTNDIGIEYFRKIKELRDRQKKLLPLFLESKRMINSHRKCLSTILLNDKENLPFQLQRVIDKG